MAFDSNTLKEIYQQPVNVAEEPISNFPLQYYEFFLREVKRLGIKVITYNDLFHDCGDRDHQRFYPSEYKLWQKKRSKNDVYLLIQHDVDNHPFFTKRMVALEALYGVRSNIFMFCDRYTSNGPDPSYQIDHDFFLNAERQGFVIGYHQNAFALAGFDMEKAVERYRHDVRQLRKIYNIEFVVPHGGAGGVIDGRTFYNVDVPMPEDVQKDLRWVFNRYGVKFDKKWSDGGLRKTRDVRRIKTFDLVGHFLHNLKKGTRNFCLVHPQRWGYNVDTEQNPLLAQEEWYRKICAGTRS